MNQIVDGSQDLPTQENAIRNFEANGFELTDLAPDNASPPDNIATFKQLPIGQLPKRLVLQDAATPVPPGKTVFWMGTIHVKSALKPALAFRR